MRVTAKLCLSFALTILLAPAAHAASPLVGQWHVEDTANAPGTPFLLVTDSSGNGLDLIGNQNNTQVDGRFGKTRSITQGVGYASDFGSDEALAKNVLTRPARLTLMAWVKWGPTGAPIQLKYIAGRGNDGAACGGSSYALYSGADTTADGPKSGLRFYIRTKEAGARAYWSPPAKNSEVYDNKFHMVAGTFDGTKVRLYVDGTEQTEAGGEVPSVPAGTEINYALPNANANNATNAFYLGAYSSPQCSGGAWTNNPVDEVRLYDRALTQPEINRLSDPAATVPPTLIEDSMPPVLPGGGGTGTGGGSTPVTPAGTSLVDRAKPTVSGLSFSKSSFAAATSGASVSAKRKKTPVGTKVSLRLSEAAALRFTVESKQSGRKAGRKCVAPKRSNRKKPRCTRYVSKGSFAVTGKSGANSFTFRGRVGGKSLKPGSYRLTGQATDKAKNKSSVFQKSFTIIK